MNLMLLSAALAASSPVAAPIGHAPWEPTVNLSAVRKLACANDLTNPLDGWTGTGFLVRENVLATALHVAAGSNCIDVETKAPLITYHRDGANDFALMTGELPKMPYVRIRCAPYKTGERYNLFGHSGYFQPKSILRYSTVVAGSDYTDEKFLVGKEMTPWPGMRHLKGYSVPGTSGGPITDLDGYATGIVNAGSHFFGVPLPHQFSYELRNTILCKGQAGK